MNWITELKDLQATIAEELPRCSRGMRALYAATAIRPEQWQADMGYGGVAAFWAVAVHQHRVLWYNHYEGGFNVSSVPHWGAIGEYWCNDDSLAQALPLLAGRPGRGWRLGPPVPIPPFTWD